MSVMSLVLGESREREVIVAAQRGRSVGGKAQRNLR
jgi:hypothetical protein